MGLLARMRELARGPERRILGELAAAYRDEVRMVRQLRLHAESVPYLSSAPVLLGLAEQEDAHAALLGEEITRLGGTASAADTGEPRQGRNYWERLTLDLEDLRAKTQHYLELAHHWDIEYPDTAELFRRLAHAEATMGRPLGEMIARSDPHAAD